MPLHPPEFLVKRLQQKKCILFVGSGLSAAAGLPTWRGLLEEITIWTERQRPGAASVAEVRALLAKDKFIEVAQHLRDVLGLDDLQRALAEQLDVKNRPLPAVHNLIAQLPFRAIVTTNFDQLIERAYGYRIPVATQLDAEKLAEYIGDPDQQFLLKAHGDLTRADTIVLAEQEFSRLINRDEAFKRSFISLIMTHAVLFVGYSLADPDFRLLLDDQADLFGKGGPPRFALISGLTEIERKNLFHKTIQVLHYDSHDEVPEFFRALLDALQQEPAAETTNPPDALPLLRSPSVLADSRAAERLDQARIITQFENGTKLEMELLLLNEHPEIRQALREHLGGEKYERLRALVAAQVEQRVERMERGNVVIVPGMMGSKLSVRDASGRSSVIWLNLLGLAMGGISKLSLSAGAPTVAATGVAIANYLDKLTRQLKKRWNVRVFAYDWRQDFNEVANDLRRFLASEFGEGEPSHLVAHSSGGLVARAFISRYRDAWERLQPADMANSARGGRLVMLGTPNHGSFAPLTTLTGREQLLRSLAMLDVRNSSEDIRRVFATFPSFYQMLPSPYRNRAWEALYDAHSYSGLSVSQELLDRGLAFHDNIASAVEPERMVCILGHGQLTTADVEKPNDLRESEHWIVTRDGDGVTPHTLARLELGGAAVPTYFVDERGGDLPINQHVAGALDEILRVGVTFSLRTTPDAPLQRRVTPEEKLKP